MKSVVKALCVFALGGLFGGLLEIGYQIVTKGHFVFGGFLYGPFRPIYGYGFLIIYLVGKRIHRNPLGVFFISFIICSIFEYSVSYLLEVLFNRTWWDYTNFYLNLNGRICIMISLFWGLLGLVFVKLIIPIFDRVYEKINKKYVYLFLTLGGVLYIFDTVVSIIGHLR